MATFQAKFITKLAKYEAGEPQVSLESSVDKNELNTIIKSILKQTSRLDQDSFEKVAFEFIVCGRILNSSVEKHLEIYADELNVPEILNEKLLDIEYFISLVPPEPQGDISQDDWVSCIDANDRYIISGSYDNSIRIFSVHDRKNLATIAQAHEKPVTRVKWLKTPKTEEKNVLYFISCGHDEVAIIRKFNTKTLKFDIVFILKGHNRSVNCVDCNDDLVATGSFDKTLRLWSTDDGIESRDIENEPEGDVGGKKKKRKTKALDTTKAIASNASAKNATMTLTGHQESVTGVRWLQSCNEYNSVASCSMDRSICIWDVEVGECKRKILSSKPLLGIDYCNDKNLIVSACCDRYIRLWDARAPDNATAKSVYTSHNAWVSSVAFGHSTNNFISGGYDNLVKLWDVRSPKACIYDLIGHHDKVLDVNWSNKDFVLSGSADSTLKVFSTR